MAQRFAIKVIWLEGEEEYLKEGESPDGEVALFTSRKRAEAQRDFMLVGMEDEVQSVNIVPYPVQEVDREA